MLVLPLPTTPIEHLSLHLHSIVEHHRIQSTRKIGKSKKVNPIFHKLSQLITSSTLPIHLNQAIRIEQSYFIVSFPIPQLSDTFATHWRLASSKITLFTQP